MNTLETPIVQTLQKTFTHYSIQFENLVLHKEITLVINLFNQESHSHSAHYKIEGEEYQQWGDDDSYIDSIIQRELQKLNTESPSE